MGAFHDLRIGPGTVFLNGTVIGVDYADVEQRTLAGLVTGAVEPDGRPLASYLADLPSGDRKELKREGDVVLLERPDVDFVVAFDRPGDPVRQRRRYFNFPTKTRTRKEAREAAEREFTRRTSC